MRRWLPSQIMFAVVVVLSLLSLQMVFAQNATPTPLPGQTIQLQRTDTLVGLAARFGKPVACLQAANNLASTNFSLTSLTVILIPENCNGLLAINNEATPTPESIESLVTATFTPLPTNASSATKIAPTATVTRAATATLAAGTTAVPTLVPTLVSEQTYTVVSGDRLARIAQSFGLTVACVAAANNIANPDLIYIGQQLLISPNCSIGTGGGVVSSTTSVSSVDRQSCQFDRNAGRVSTGDQYVVQSGDALDFIACDFGVELQCLKDSNPQLGGLSALVPGQTLNINFSCPIWRDASLPQPTATG